MSRNANAPMYSGELSFMDLGYRERGEGIDLGVLGVAFDSSVSNRGGAKFGPRSIREATKMLSWERAYGWEPDPLSICCVRDLGDLDFDYGIMGSIIGSLYNKLIGCLEGGVGGTLLLGGDHFITYPSLRAYHDYYGERVALLHFDAHTDTWADSGERIDHGSFLYRGIKEGLVDIERSIQVGIRTWNDYNSGMEIIDIYKVHSMGMVRLAERIRSRIGGGRYYISLDIDCLDPSYAPGTGTPVCGGMTMTQMMVLFKILSSWENRPSGMDIVEVSPPYDTSEITSLAAATLALEMIGLYSGAKYSNR